MSEHRDPEAYRQQARLWQEKADVVPYHEERDIFLVIADGYIRLAQLIERRAPVDIGTGDGQQSAVG
jgi:hypothetical protein